MAIASLGGLDCYYELHGIDDGPRLLNIGGTGGDLRRTFPDRLPLNARFRVLSFDQRGLGRTDKPETDYTMHDYADDAAALVASVGWDRCHVMGTSFGGMVALHLAVRHPELIDRLVLNCTSPGGGHSSYPLHQLGGLPTDEVFAVRMRLTDGRWDPTADEPIPGLGSFYDLIVAQATATPAPDDLAGLTRQLAARAEHDVVDQLGCIDHETLVCAGRYDEMAPLANSEFLVERMPNATLQVFDGGHLFLLQDRTAYGSIADFLAA